MSQHLKVISYRFFSLQQFLHRIFPLCLLCCFLLLPTVHGQNRFDLKYTNRPLREALEAFKQSSGMQVFYNEEKINTARLITADIRNASPDEALKQLLDPLDLTYEIINGTVVISTKNGSKEEEKRSPRFRISGKVTDEKGQPLPGATIVVKGSRSIGIATDKEGNFTLQVNHLQETLLISYVGYVTLEVNLHGKEKLNIRLEPDILEIEAVIATGFYPRAKNSFTGTAVSVEGEALRNINNINIFDALKVFDPSFRVVDERGLWGSDPNRIPDRIEIRGQNSFPEISEGNLNTLTSLPIFILDGFEINVEQVIDLDMNRIKHVTILKDASASAIYGSRAANGVIVIETKAPESGKLQISYNLSGSIQLPDLSSYNLMNAAEALEFQYLAGVFEDKDDPDADPRGRMNSYHVIKKEVMAGTDTYWLSKSLRVAFLQKHTLFIEGVVKKYPEEYGQLRYQINLSAGSNKGVMKGSERNQYSGGTKLMFQGNNINIINDLQFSMVNSKESPYGKFSTYTETLPYYREKDENGHYYRNLSLRNVAPPDMALEGFSAVISPIYEAKYLNSFTGKESIDFSNSLGLNWAVKETLRLKGNFKVSHSSSRTDAFVSPLSNRYTGNSSFSSTIPGEILNRGKYELEHTSGLTFSGNVVLSYTESFGKHLLQGILGGELKQEEKKSERYAVTGFLGNGQDYLSYGYQFEVSGRPYGNESTIRSAGTFINLNYAYDNRYLVDLTGRIDGSSLFGRDQRSAPFWSTGIRWNISRERFMEKQSFIRNLAIRATIGTIGNQNFSLNQAMSLYQWMSPVYGPFTGAKISTLGNPELECQITYNRNIGLDMSLWEGRFNLTFNYYNNLTKGNLTDITIAPSIGFSNYKTNMGDLNNSGIDFSLSVTPVRTNDLLLSLNLNGYHNKNKIKRISDVLKNYNDMIGEIAEKEHVNVFLFREGESMNTIYAVPSLGIDPGTGMELFLTKEGERTYTWKAEDQVAVGCKETVLEGYFGFNLQYKAWDLGASFRYSTGGDMYNYTLHEKIEGVDYMKNNDRRALKERWKSPGDVARYKALRDNSKTNSTSRFVQKEHVLSLPSLRLSYTLPAGIIRNSTISLFKFSATMNDIFYLSSVKQERGVNYPFARTINFTAQINF